MDFDGIMTRLSDLSGSSDHREKPQQNQPMSENDIDRGFPNHYEQLQGSEHIVHGPRWSTDKLLTTYVSATDGLIGKMDGSIPFSKTAAYFPNGNMLVKEKRDLPPPTGVIYLDKSARPVEWMVRGLWDLLAAQKNPQDKQGPAPEMPSSHFLNIDKGDWLMRMHIPPKDLEDTPVELIDFDLIDKEHIARLRALYSTVPIDEETPFDAWNHPTIFDGQHIMVVDEIASSGQTLNIALNLLSRAIPEATFSGSYWAVPKRIALKGGAPVDDKMQFMREWVPVWYSQEFITGRGVRDRDPRWPEIAEETYYRGRRKNSTPSHVSKLGRHLISTPPHDPRTHLPATDLRSRQLRKEISYLAGDVTDHHILYQPSPDRPSDSDDDFELIRHRIESLNGLPFDEWRKKRDAIFRKDQ